MKDILDKVRPIPVPRHRLDVPVDEQPAEEPRRLRGTRRRQVLLVHDHATAWTRLQELHDRAVGVRRWRPAVLSAELTTEGARDTYCRALGAALGSVLVASPDARQAIAQSLARHVLERESLRGLEPLLVTALTATVESRRSGYDVLLDAIGRLGLGTRGSGRPGPGGLAGVPVLDARDGSVSFLRNGVLTDSLDVLHDVVGRPGGDGGPPLGDGRARSNDPALVGMNAERADVICEVVGTVVGGTVTWGINTAATLGAPMTKGASLLLWGASAVAGTSAGYFTEKVCVDVLVDDVVGAPADGDGDDGDGGGNGDGDEGEPKDSDDPATPEDPDDPEKPADGEDKDGKDGTEDTVTPNPMDDGVTTYDIEYVAAVLAAHGPRTVESGGPGFWTDSGVLVSPLDMLTNPPLSQEEGTGTLDRPVNLPAMLDARKKPVNPQTGGDFHYAGSGTAPDVMVVIGAPSVPMVQGDDGRARFPYP